MFEILNSKGHKFVTGTFSKPVIAWHADNNRHHPPNGIFLNFATTRDADESEQKLDGIESLDFFWWFLLLLLLLLRLYVLALSRERRRNNPESFADPKLYV